MSDKNRIKEHEEFIIEERMYKKYKKQLTKYIRENLSKGQSLESIKKALVNYGYDELFASYLIKTYKKQVNIVKYSIAAFMLILFSLSLFFIQPAQIGFITMDKEFNYTDNVNLVVDNDFEYTWLIGNYGSLKSIRLDGSLSKEGSAKVYLEHDDESYLVFDSLRLGEEGIGKVLGLVVGDEVNESTDNSLNKTTENKFSELYLTSLNKTITITIEGGGSKALDDVFEFDINSSFNWGMDYSKVCAKWDVNLVSVCYGSSDCCALIGLESLGAWNDTFYLSYGRYSAGLENIIKAQVIHANYSLDVEEPYSDIVYSDIKESEAEFYEEVISFEDICVDTCLLPGLNATSYKLVFIIENTTLRIDNIKYSIEKAVNISRNAPELIKEYENITIYKNEDKVINLSEYFYDEDNDSLTYTVYETENISVVIKNSIARIVPSYNFTDKRYMFFTASDGYYNISSNIFFINIIEKPLQPEEVNVSEQLIKPSIVINKPARWTKVVNASDRVINLSINISSDALNVSVTDVKKDRVISEDKIKINDKGVIKNTSVYRAEKRIKQIEKIEDELNSKKLRIIREEPTALEKISSINKELLELKNERNKLTGYVVAASGKGLITRFFEWLFNVEITSYVVYELSENESSNVTSVIIEDIIEDVEIEYYTEGPISKEENISYGKRIVVSSDIHYEDILAYTYLDDISQHNIKLYHIVNNSKELVNSVSYYDENNNSLIDMIEWVIPSLSNETYEVIIEIIKAEHLDSNRNFIADVYGYVKEKDNNWTTIPSNDYIRVTFEIPLDNTRDITIYARSNETAEIEVYTENDDTLITKFENIPSENWYKVYLMNLNESHKTFDLKILNSSVELDYIVDPKIGPAGNISFVPPTPINNTNTTNTSIEINISIKANLSEFKWNWNGTNYTFYNESLVLMFNFDNVSALGENYNNSNGSVIVDVSNYSNNGTLYVGDDFSGNYTAGRYGGAFEFDGIDDYVLVSAHPSIDIYRKTAMTFGAWIYPKSDGQNDYGRIVDKANSSAVSGGDLGYTFYVTSEESGTVVLCSEIAHSTDEAIGCTLTDLTINDWHHVAFTYNEDSDNKIKVYIDGSLAELAAGYDQAGVGSIEDDSSVNLKIGNYAGPNNRTFNGTIDEVRIYNRSLSAAEIKQQYYSNLRKYDIDKWEFYSNQSNLTDEIYTYQGFAKDTAGNENSTEIRTLTTDTTAPTVTIIYPTNGSNISSNSIDVNASAIDDLASSLTYYWVINGTTNTTTVDSNSTFNASDGYYNLTLFVSDSLQNGSDTIYFRLDTTAPSWSNNETNATLMKINGNATFNITVSDYGSTLSFYIFSWNGTGEGWLNDTNGTINGNSIKLIINKSTNLSQGNNIGYRWYANDSAGNWNNSLLRTFTVANSVPTTPDVTYPKDGKNYSNIPYINYSSTDADGDTITYDIYINGTLNISIENSNVTQWNASDGFYNLTVTARDSTNSSANSSVRHFRLDSVAPSFSNQEKNETPAVNEDLRMNITITDANCYYYRFFWNNTGTLTNDTALSCTSGVVSTTKTGMTAHQRICWGYWANDTAGNSNSSSLDCFTVGNTAPAFSGTIASQTWNEGTNLTNIFELSDYFSDTDNDPLTYTATGNSSISVIIDQTTSNVTLTQTTDWYGTETIYFTATDGENSADSNTLTLTVTNVPDCGDNVKETGEECDGADLGGQSCISRGYDAGTLRCTSSCTVDTSGCYNVPTSAPPPPPPPAPPPPAPPPAPPPPAPPIPVPTPPPKGVPPVAARAAPISATTLPCRRITYTETNESISIERSVLSNETISEGYEVILEPFSLKCNGETVDFTVSIPEDYADITLLRCEAGICSPATITKTTKLQCLDLISREVKRVHEQLEPEYVNLKIKETKVNITEVKKVLQSGDSSVRFYGAIFKNLTAEIKKSEKAIEEAKNPYLKITGTPLIIKLNRKENLSSAIKLPYTEEENIEMESLGIYAKIKDGWDYIGGEIDKEEKLVSVNVSDISAYLDENNTAIFTLMGIICEYCYNSSLEKVYNGTTREAIILVHGLASSPETFNEIIGDIKLTEQPFQAWTFGYSSQRTMEEISKEFSDLLEAHSNEFDKIYIAAHSLGGLIAQKALYDSYNSNYSYINKVKKAILVGVPNEGSVFIGVYEKLYRSLINKAAKYKNIFNVNSKLVDNLKEGIITPKVPTIDYYVIAGTNPYELGRISELRFINETHDGIVTVKSAQRIGDSYINDRCSDYWDIYLTHTQLIDDDTARKLIERIVAREILNETGFENIIGHTKYFELKIVNCNSKDKYIVTGKKVSEEEILDPTMCLCGNGICGEGENELNCPADCVEKPIPKKRNWSWLIILTIIITLTGYYKYRKHKVAKELIRFEKLHKEGDELIEENKLREAIQNYRELKNKYNELNRLPVNIKEKYKIYLEIKEELEKIIRKLKTPEFKFDILISKVEAKIKENKIKEAIEDYIKLREIYEELIKKSNLAKRRILYNKIRNIHRKLEKLKKG